MKLKPLCRLMLMCWAIPVHANPVSPQVVHGTAGFATNGNTLTVTNSANAIINWQSFSIGANETTRFIQPSASSAVLNRVLGSDPSQILGQLQSNGRVFLINPAGILMGAGARIDVAGLVVSTLNLSNEDFLAGRMNFAANPLAGRVVNQGAITTGMGGTVVLVGAQVSNEGIITTPQGQTVLAAGETVQLQELGAPGLTVEITGTTNTATNLGRIVADAGQIGIVGVLVKNTGLVSASRVEHEGGRIFLRATEELKLSAFGDIAARGGGFVDTSAPKVKIEEGVRIDTEGGEWLIDPVDFTIAASGGDMTGATLSTNLGSGSVTIQSTSGSAGTSGNVNVNDTVSWSSNKLTLNAQNNININSPMNGSGTASLALEYGQGAVTSGNASDYYVNAPVNLPAGQNFSTKLGSDGTVKTFTVITSLGTADSYTATDLQGVRGNLSANYAMGSDIDASTTSGWNSGGGFMPVGEFSGSFNGTFSGLGHTITNLTINRPSTDNVGLFGATSSNFIIRNVGMTGGAVTGNNQVGGLVGHNNGGTIRNSYATSNVTGSNGSVGGLVGYNFFNGAISNSYATGNVTGAHQVGGLVGNNDGGTVSNGYATGKVTGNSSVGGLVGINYGTVSNSYWNTETSGRSTSAGGTGLTTAQMKQQANFSGFDFGAVWSIDAYTYPYLKANTQAPRPGTLTWDGGASTLNWWDANNWSTNQVPTATDAVYLDIAGTNAVHYIGATGSKLAGALICNENFTLDAGVLTIDGAAKWAETLDISSNALILNGTTEVATLAMTSGSIGGTGNLTVTQGYSQSAAGYINMWGSNSQIAITQATGNLNIYGALSTTGSLALRTSEATGDILIQSAVRSGNMTVSARNITLNADQNSSGDNRLVELSATGAQTITATGELMLKAGTTGQAKDAQIISLGAQNISANKITLTGGGTESGDTNNSARITHEYCRWSGSTCASGGSGNQTITLTGSNATLNLTGGAGSGAGLYYNNDCTTALGSSTACYASDNRATIQNYLGDQTITFDSTGGALTLQGGRNGGSNSADIRNAQWKNYNYGGDPGPQPGTQTIGGTSGNTATNPNITLTSGVSGGWSVYYTKNGKDVIENFENEAGIGTDGASQIIRAKDVLLDGNANATATTIGGAYMGGDPLTGNFTQTIDVTGNLTLRGGNSGGVGALNDATKKDLSGAAGLYAEARESGKTATSTITVAGDVAFTGGGSAYSPAFMATQSGSMMTLTATGTVTLDAGSSNSFVLFGRFGELADNISNWSLWAGKVKFANVGGATSVRLNANASGTALKIIGNLDNDIDAAILATPNGRWLVYAASPASVTKGGLTSNFRHYGVTNAYSPAITETGNGFLYASSAGNLSVTTTLTGGTASHEYGQTPTATFGYTLSGTFADAEDTAANIGVTDGIYSFTPTSTSTVGSYTRKYSSGMTSRAGYGFILATTDSGVAYTVNEAPVTTAPAAATTASNDVTTSTIAATTTVTASETTTVATAAVSTATTESTATTTTETTTTETTTAQSAVATTTVVISTTPATSNLPSVTLVGGTTGGGTNEFGGSTTTPATTVTTTTTVTTVAEPTQSEAPKAQESKPADKPKENKPKEDKPKEDKPQDKPKDDKPKAKPKQCA